MADSHVDPEAVKAFWWAISWGGAFIFSTAVWIIEGAVAIVVTAFLGSKIVAFIKEVF